MVPRGVVLSQVDDPLFLVIPVTIVYFSIHLVTDYDTDIFMDKYKSGLVLNKFVKLFNNFVRLFSKFGMVILENITKIVIGITILVDF